VNCLTYAIKQYRKHGGYIAMRRSKIAEMRGSPKWSPLWLVPHFLWIDRNGHAWQYVPLAQTDEWMLKSNGLWAWTYLWSFKGRVVSGDDYYGKTLILWRKD